MADEKEGEGRKKRRRGGKKEGRRKGIARREARASHLRASVASAARERERR